MRLIIVMLFIIAGMYCAAYFGGPLWLCITVLAMFFLFAAANWKRWI